MKLLLTSKGIVNLSLAEALSSLMSKPYADSNVMVITTASNSVPEDKSWLIRELDHLYALGWSKIFLHDLFGIDRDTLQTSLDRCDVLYVIGGNPWYLMFALEYTQMTSLIRDFIQSKVYVGSSAGAAVMCRYFSSDIAGAWDIKVRPYSQQVKSGLGDLDFFVKSHYRASYFPARDDKWAQKLAAGVGRPTYFIDDNSAVRVIDGKVDVVTEGQWLLLNEKEDLGTRSRDNRQRAR